MEGIYRIVLNGKALEYNLSEGKSVYRLMLDSGAAFSAPCGGNGKCGKCLVRLVSGKVRTADGEYAQPNSDIAACSSYPEGDCEVIYRDSSPAVCETNDNTVGKSESRVGIAIDIGTTTIGAYFYEMESGTLLYSCSACNLQAGYGADVITRLNYASYERGGLEELRGVVIGQINGFIRMSRISSDRISDIVIAGNTAMQHIAAGISPRGICEYPYTPESLFGNVCLASEIRIDAAPDAEVYFSPCISGFIGGDITAGLLFCERAFEKSTCLYIDIGTNGEIALIRGDSILTASTAAGPALEAGHITCGMCAEEGAIYSVAIDGKCESFGSFEPVGICGSALIDAMAYFLESGKVDSEGRITGGSDKVFLTDRVFITQKDIREIQLAKAAISAGIICLMNEAELNSSEIDRVIFAGGFGAAISTANACRIGLIPRELENRTMIVGNAAGEGAIKLLLDKTKRLRIEELVKKCSYRELSDVTSFVEEFVGRMNF